MGARPDILSLAGESAIDVARRFGQLGVLKALGVRDEDLPVSARSDSLVYTVRTVYTCKHSKRALHANANYSNIQCAVARKSTAGAQGFSSPAATAREEYMSVPLHGPFGNTDAAETLDLNDEQKLAAKGARTAHYGRCNMAAHSRDTISSHCVQRGRAAAWTSYSACWRSRAPTSGSSEANSVRRSSSSCSRCASAKRVT